MYSLCGVTHKGHWLPGGLGPGPLKKNMGFTVSPLEDHLRNPQLVGSCGHTFSTQEFRILVKQVYWLVTKVEEGYSHGLICYN